MRLWEISKTASRQYNKLIPPSGILASYTDNDGYTVSIEGMPNDPTDCGRCGQIYISNGKVKIPAGYWMNYPEKSWNISPRKNSDMSWVDRAKLEVKQQATAYKPLKDQFIALQTRDRSEDDEHEQKMIEIRKLNTQQPLTATEAAILKPMVRSEFHYKIDQLTQP